VSLGHGAAKCVVVLVVRSGHSPLPPLCPAACSRPTQNQTIPSTIAESQATRQGGLVRQSAAPPAQQAGRNRAECTRGC
jgi:hypothetical protein